MHPVPERRRQLRNIGGTAALHRLPQRLPADGQQTVVVEEANHGQRREGADGGQRGRPDGRRHRQQVAVGEQLAEEERIEELAERHPGRFRRGQQAWRLAVEAEDFCQQAEVRRADEIARLREEAAHAAAAVFEVGANAGHGKAHVGRHGVDAEFGEQPHQARIGLVVVHEEAGVERNRAARAVGQHRMRVPAQPPVLFEQVHVMTTAEKVGGREARDAAADHCKAFHGREKPDRGTPALSRLCP